MSDVDGRAGCIYIISCLLRPGAIYFATELEEQYFSPDTSANDDYTLFQLTYCGLPHYIIEIPSHSYGHAMDVAKRYNLIMVNGKPNSPSAGEFRLSCAGDQCFTLETLDQSILPVDLSDMLKREAAGN